MGPPLQYCQLCEGEEASEASKARRSSKGNLNCLRSLSHLHAPAEKTPAKFIHPCTAANSSGNSAQVPHSCSDNIKYSTNTIFKIDF